MDVLFGASCWVHIKHNLPWRKWREGHMWLWWLNALNDMYSSLRHSYESQSSYNAFYLNICSIHTYEEWAILDRFNHHSLSLKYQHFFLNLFTWHLEARIGPLGPSRVKVCRSYTYTLSLVPTSPRIRNTQLVPENSQIQIKAKIWFSRDF